MQCSHVGVSQCATANLGMGTGSLQKFIGVSACGPLHMPKGTFKMLKSQALCRPLTVRTAANYQWCIIGRLEMGKGGAPVHAEN
jgi:hypothetical protein